MNKNYTYCLIITILIGCGPGRNDFYVSLPGNYYLWRNNSIEVRVSPQGYDETTPIIPPTITHAAWDKTWVYAKRNDPKTNLEDYWILNCIKPEVYGPLTHKQYSDKISELSINDPILIDIYEYRKIAIK